MAKAKMSVSKQNKRVNELKRQVPKLRKKVKTSRILATIGVMLFFICFGLGQADVSFDFSAIDMDFKITVWLLIGFVPGALGVVEYMRMSRFNKVLQQCYDELDHLGC